jgi:uncharacterized phiE125 gp8 family phage protein
MRRFLVNKPLVEPLSLTDAKNWLRVDHGDDDVMIANLITSAREMVEARTGRSLIAQTWRVTLDAWPDGSRVALPLLPVMTIAAVRVINASGTAVVLAPSAYALETQRDPPVLQVLAPIAPGKERNGIELDVIVGYGPAASDCPESLRQAMRLILSVAYARRGPDLPPIERANTSSDIETLLAPYRAFRFYRPVQEKLSQERLS